ncbi:MAG: hypothetical protein V2A73_17805, partial [Pseudomonadota bacterium]
MPQSKLEPERAAEKSMVVPAFPPPPPPPPPPLTAAKKSVELDDEEHVVEDPPADAEYWSDKNRRVEQQTQAQQRNLAREAKGERVASAEGGEQNSPEIGGKNERTAELEDNAPETIARPPTAHSSRVTAGPPLASKHTVQREDQRSPVHEAGGRPDKPAGLPGPLGMRDIEGRGAPGAGTAPLPRGLVEDETAGVVLVPGVSGVAGGGDGKPNLRLGMASYERIVGSDRAHEEVVQARTRQSLRKGRWERKLGAIRSSLENFVPEVRPGNQTALGTRAHPFALYLARMHRRIHELWGFGFLAGLDDKPASNPMNDP